MIGRFSFGLIFAVIVFGSRPAWADIPPPPGYVEKCTVSAEQKSGQDCRACRAWHGGREDCEKLAAQGFTQRCRAGGASTWQEVWCRNTPQKDRKAAVDRTLAETLVTGGSLTLAVIFGGVWVARKIKKKSPRGRFDVEPDSTVPGDDGLPQPTAAAKPESKNESRRRNR
jgi:hypothetical protein